ncbi:hypothetical protein FRB96_000725 [Tulasnella sp. 330]|nr:hypothetical protein FRB96_000725 [Tulasnella sp. 330]
MWRPGHARASPSDSTIRLMWIIPASYIRALRLRNIIGALVFLASIHFFLFSGHLSFSYIDPKARTSSVLHQAGSGGGRVLITGGGGSIGKYLVRRLLSNAIPVTILDIKFDPKDLKAIRSEFPSTGDLLLVKTGDVRDTHVLGDVMASDVEGVIHLAAISRMQWCLEDKMECSNVNEKGTDAVLNALRDLNRRDKGRRWFVLASSRSVHDVRTFLTNRAESEPTQPADANAYGVSKLTAERILETHIQSYKQDVSPGGLYAIALRLPNVYGDASDHVDRLIPNLFTQALSHQTVQVVEGQQNLDMLYIDDCVDAFLLAIKSLKEHSQKWSLFSPRTYLDMLDVASGTNDVSVTHLVDKIIRLTRSKSPIRTIPTVSGNKLVSIVPEYEGSKGSAPRLPQLTDAVSLDDGLLRLTRAYLKRTEHALTNQIHSTCSQLARPITDTDLLKFDNCTAYITFDVLGQSHVLSNKDLGAFMMDEEFPPKPIKTFATRRKSDGKTVIRILGNAKNGEKHRRWLGVTSPITNGGVFQRELSGVEMKNVGASNALVDWELDINAELGAVRLLLAGTTYQLYPAALRGEFTLVNREVDIWPFRITPVCCQAPLPWPFMEDDPIDYMVEFQKYSTDRPFLASPAKALCSRLQTARNKVKRDLATLSAETITEPRRYGETSKPREWVNADPPPCSNMCSLPTVCVDTGDCQCVLSSCPAIASGPPPVNTTSNTSILPPSPHVAGKVNARNPLVAMVDKSSWRSVIRPQALTIIDAGVIPRVHVGPLAPKGQEWLLNDTEGKTAHLLKPVHCFSADATLELTLSHMNVSAEGSDYTFIPMHQGRPHANGRLELAYEYNIATTPGFDPYRVIIPFSHDWGMCLTFEWNVWDMRLKKGNGVKHLERYTRWSMGWSTMGDLNSACYRPAQDVVIPPRGCFSPQMFEAFGKMSDVRPARDRRALVTFKGNFWGTGKILRQRIMCNRLDEQGITDLPGRRLITTHPVSAVWGSYGGRPSYAAMLNDSIFCVHAIGVAGWAPRLIDAIYAGCIPVVIGHTTQFPFYDMIDWGKISVPLETSEVNRMEEILVTRYTIEDIERFQANLMLIRDAFVYPLDGANPETLVNEMFHKRGPLFFALYSTRMRMLTKWPTDASHDRP